MRLIIFLFLFTLFVNSIAFAGGRSSAGGGKIEKFNAGTWATGQAIQLGTYIIGSAIAEGMISSFKGNGFSAGFTSALSNNPSPEDLTLTTGDIKRINDLNLNLPGMEKLVVRDGSVFEGNALIQTASPSFNKNFGVFDVGGAITRQASTAAPQIYNTLPGIISNFSTSYSTSFALGQTQRALILSGQSSGWDSKKTIFMSSLVGNALSGSLIPRQFGVGVTGPLNGAVLGAVDGAVEGAILAKLADKKGNLPIWASPVAGLVGNFTSSYIAGGFTTPTQEKMLIPSETLTNYDNYVQSGDSTFGPGPISDVTFAQKTKGAIPVVAPASFSFSNKFNADSALRNAFVDGVLSNLPASAVNYGVQSLTKNMNPDSAYLVRQAFSGVYPIVNTKTNILLQQFNLDGRERVRSPSLEGVNP